MIKSKCCNLEPYSDDRGTQWRCPCGKTYEPIEECACSKNNVGKGIRNLHTSTICSYSAKIAEEEKQKGIDYSKDNIYDAIGRPDLKPKCCTECKNGGKIGVPLLGCCNGCKCHDTGSNEIIEIFENVYGDFLLPSWFERTSLEKERKLEEFTRQLNKWISFDGFE